MNAPFHDGSLCDHPVVSPPRPTALSTATALLEQRTARRKAFPELSFVDTEWFILLELFVAAETERRLSLSDIYYVADVPKSTAIRAIDRLVDSGHLFREPDPLDARRKLVRLRGSTHRRLIGLLERLLRTSQPSP